jgi:hypothetical protein
MDYAGPPGRSTKDEFKPRRNRVYISILILIACAAPWYMGEAWSQAKGIPPDLGPVLAFVGIGQYLFIVFTNWKCPACDRYLGKAMYPTKCAGCGADLA